MTLVEYVCLFLLLTTLIAGSLKQNEVIEECAAPEANTISTWPIHTCGSNPDPSGDNQTPIQMCFTHTPPVASIVMWALLPST